MATLASLISYAVELNVSGLLLTKAITLHSAVENRENPPLVAPIAARSVNQN
jgi:hypothetical protein